MALLRHVLFCASISDYLDNNPCLIVINIQSLHLFYFLMAQHKDELVNHSKVAIPDYHQHTILTYAYHNTKTKKLYRYMCMYVCMYVCVCVYVCVKKCPLQIWRQ